MIALFFGSDLTWMACNVYIFIFLMIIVFAVCLVIYEELIWLAIYYLEPF